MNAQREKLIWAMAEKAWRSHFCHADGKPDNCTFCKGTGKCFELGGGFRNSSSDEYEWFHTARGALEALEEELGVAIFPDTDNADQRQYPLPFHPMAPDPDVAERIEALANGSA